MATPETELILRALDDLRDDLNQQRSDTRADFATVFARLDETRQLVARLDERTKPADSSRAKTRRDRVTAVVRQHAPTAGVSAIVATALQLVPELIKALHGGG